MTIHDGENEQPIDTLYAVLSVDDKGHEGICGLEGLGPMVCGYERIAKQLLELAQGIPHDTGKSIVLAKFRREQ